MSAENLAKPAEPDSRLAQLRRFYYDTAGATNPINMQGLKALVLTRQIVFGTDAPFFDGAPQVAGLRSSGFTAEELGAVERDNALAFLPRYASTTASDPRPARVTPRTALVVGAGIGGLAAGIALGRAGWRVRIFERAASPRELGFALNLAPNAMFALKELGLAERLLAEGHAPTRAEMRGPGGRLLRRLEVPPGVFPEGMPSVVALRPVLHGALLGAVNPDRSSSTARPSDSTCRAPAWRSPSRTGTPPPVTCWSAPMASGPWSGGSCTRTSLRLAGAATTACAASPTTRGSTR